MKNKTEVVEENVDVVDGELEEDEKTEDEDTEVHDSESEDQEVDDDENVENSEDDSGDPEEDIQDEDDSITITIDGEEYEDSLSEKEKEKEQAPEWVRELRKKNRELVRQNRELQKKIESNDANTEKSIELGPRPKIEDFDYDSDRYEKSLEEWLKKKSDFDRQESEKLKQEEKRKESWNNRLKTFEEQKKGLRVKDYEEAEFNVIDSLSKEQQAAIIEYSDKPAELVYAIGNNPKKLKELSEKKDLGKFIREFTKLESRLKIQENRKPSVKPEKRLKSKTSASAVDSVIDKKREEAQRTGDWSDFYAYKKSLKKSQ